MCAWECAAPSITQSARRMTYLRCSLSRRSHLISQNGRPCLKSSPEAFFTMEKMLVFKLNFEPYFSFSLSTFRNPFLYFLLFFVYSIYLSRSFLFSHLFLELMLFNLIAFRNIFQMCGQQYRIWRKKGQGLQMLFFTINIHFGSWKKQINKTKRKNRNLQRRPMAFRFFSLIQWTRSMPDLGPEELQGRTVRGERCCCRLHPLDSSLYAGSLEMASSVSQKTSHLLINKLKW